MDDLTDDKGRLSRLEVKGSGNVIGDGSLSQVIQVAEGSSLKNVMLVGGDYQLNQYYLYISDQRGAAAVASLGNLPISLKQTEDGNMEYARWNVSTSADQFALLPLDRVPDPTAPARVSRIPHSHNPMFVGRQEELREIAFVFKGESREYGGSIPTVVLSGIGGAGKTQLASEFAHRYGQFFPGGVFWLNFSDPAGVAAEVAVCGGASGLNLQPSYELLSLTERVSLVQAAWKDSLPRLMIFDNCEDPDLLVQWRPTIGGCCILVTSRSAVWDQVYGVHMVQVGGLRRSESIDLIRKYRPDLMGDDPSLQELCDELGDLPLAVCLAASYLSRYRHSVDLGSYLAQLYSSGITHPSMSSSILYSPTQHELDLGRTFAISLSRLDTADTVDRMASQLIASCAYFASGEPISRSLLLKTAYVLHPSIDATQQIEDSLIRLMELGLLERDGSSGLRIHRLVAAYVQETQLDPHFQMAAEEGLLAESLDLRRRPDRLDDLYLVQRHLRWIAGRNLSRGDLHAARLLHEEGCHLNMLAGFADAIPYLRRAVEIHTELLNPDLSATADSLLELGKSLMFTGAYEQAFDCCEQARAMRISSFGSDDSSVAEVLDQLGVLTHMTGAPDQARAYLGQALALRERHLGKHDLAVASTRFNLGVLELDVGDYQLAHDHLEQSLMIRSGVLGESHFDTLATLNALGSVCLFRRDYLSAQAYLGRAASIADGTESKHYLTNVQVLQALGWLSLMKGEAAQSASHFNKLELLVEKIWGREHPRTAEALTVHALALTRQGRSREAASLLQRAWDILQHSPETNRLRIADVLYVWGLVKFRSGDYSHSVTCFHEVIIISEKSEFPNHALIQVCRKAVALAKVRSLLFPIWATALWFMSGLFITSGRFAPATTSIAITWVILSASTVLSLVLLHKRSPTTPNGALMMMSLLAFTGMCLALVISPWFRNQGTVPMAIPLLIAWWTVGLTTGACYFRNRICLAIGVSLWGALVGSLFVSLLNYYADLIKLVITIIVAGVFLGISLFHSVFTPKLDYFLRLSKLSRLTSRNHQRKTTPI